MVAATVGFEDGAVFEGALFDGECVVPLTFDAVEGILFVAFLEECGSEAVFLARHPSFAGVVDFGDVAAGGGYRGVSVEFYER